MPRVQPIEFEVELLDPTQNFYTIECNVVAPLLVIEARPKERGFLGVMKDPDPPAMFVERRFRATFRFSYVEGWIERRLHKPKIEIDSFDAITNANSDVAEKIRLGALSTFEVVNRNQRDGRQPFTIPLKGSGPNSWKFTADQAPTTWEVAALNQVTGERLLAARTHAEPDDCARITHRLNQLVEYGHQIADMQNDVFPDEEDAQADLHEWCLANPPRFVFG